MNLLSSTTTFTSRLKFAALSALLVFAAACSNPLSSSNTSSIQNFHSKNVNCDELKFSDDVVTNDQVRSLIHCLNSHGEIDAFETLMDSVSDPDLTSITTLLNTLINDQPKFLYALRAAYQRAQKDGDIRTVERTLSKVLASPAMNAQIASVLQKVSTPVLAAFFNSELNFSLSGTYTLLKAQSFQRMGTESFSSGDLKNLLIAVAHYENAKDATSIQSLYDQLTKAKFETVWKSTVAQNEKTHLQKMAHFFEWLETDGRYELLSQSVRHMTDEPVKCFGGSVTIPNSLAEVIPEITALNSKSVKTYLNHDIKNLFFTAQGYCTFPFQSSAVLKLMQDATNVQGFDEVFTIVKPLISNPDFIKFMGSEASEHFMHDIAPLAHQHFFEDLFTLVTLHAQNPISSNGSELASILDQFMKPLSDAEVGSVVDFLTPLFNQTDAYGEKLVQSFYQMSYDFPDVTPTLSQNLKDSLKTSLQDIILKPALSPVLDLCKKLIMDHKLEGVIDQTLIYFAHYFDSGKFIYTTAPAVDPHTLSLPSASYLLGKIVDNVTAAPNACDELNYDWLFTNYSASNSSDYLKQINAIQTCIDPNQTFASAKDLITYSISTSSYSFLLQTQQSVINTFFTTDLNLSFNSLTDFLAIGQKDSDTIRSIISIGSSTTSLLKDHFLAESNLRSFVATLIKDPHAYLALAELAEDAPARTRSSAPTLDLLNLKTINTIVTRYQTLPNAPVEDGLKALMQQYCPSLDPTQSNCLVDPDQVALYQQSATLLFQKIAQEELSSTQSWMHPVLNTGWTHTQDPTDVSDFEYHFNPTLHLLRKSPNAGVALMNVVSRVNADKIPIAKFLTDRAVRLTLIPYYFSVPNFPTGSSRQYHNLIRFRVVNDLDRLELIALNADFKPLGLFNNFGMGFLKQIGLAWGDVPESERPASLSRFVKPGKVQSLSEVKVAIENELDSFDRGIIQSLGSHSNTFADISSRIFNLRFLVSLLQDELPEADGGHGGMVFLRDLFYSLYEGNSDAQRGQLNNGVVVTNSACLENPLSFSDVISDCQKDLLTFVPYISHLGLLHEAGIAVLNSQSHPINAVGSIINKTVTDSSLSQAFVSLLADDAGIQVMTDAVDFGFQAQPGTGANLSLITELASIPVDTNWIKFGFELAQADSHVVSENTPLLNSLLTINATSLNGRADQWLANSKTPTPEFLEYASARLTPAVRTDAVNLLRALEPQDSTLADIVTSAKNLSDFQSQAIKKDVSLWATKFADAPEASVRTSFSQWTLSPDFNQFCDVFSDSNFTTKAYNFLESVNHNADSKAFLSSCRQFLNLH